MSARAVRLHAVRAAALASLVALAGCARRGPTPRPPLDVPAPAPQINLDPLQRVVGDLGVTLLRRLAQARQGDVVVSPAGAAVALALLHEAAGPAAAARVREQLGLATLEPTAITAEAEALRDSLMHPGRSVASRAAMALWLPTDPPPRTSFARIARGRYRARLTPLDLGLQSGQATLDRWFEWATTGALKHAPEPAPTSALVMGAAAMPRAAWFEPFDPADSRPGTLHRADGTDREVTLLHRRVYAKVGQLQLPSGNVERVDIALGSGEASFTVLLPPRRDGLGALLAEVTPERWMASAATAKFEPLDLALPRLALADVARLDTLTGLDGLDVSGAVPGALQLGPLWLVTPLRLDEYGINEPPPNGRVPPSPSRFAALRAPQARAVVCDRPFAFVLAHATSGTPLYLGLVR